MDLRCSWHVSKEALTVPDLLGLFESFASRSPAPKQIYPHSQLLVWFIGHASEAAVRAASRRGAAASHAMGDRQLQESGQSMNHMCM